MSATPETLAVNELTADEFFELLRTRPKDPGSFIVEFGATAAMTVLEKHGKLNRRISTVHAKQLAQDMLGGRWEINGETVIFDVEGKLEDGYHRFTGAAAYGTSFKTFVSIGVPKNSWQSIDQGRARTLANVLTWDGLEETQKLQSVIRFCITYETGVDRASVSGPTGLNWLKDNPNVQDSLFLYKETRAARIGLSPTLAVGLHYEAIKAGHDRTKVDDFFTKLTTGLGLEEGSPVYALRKKMLADATKSRTGRSGFTSRQQHFMVVRALNAFMSGEEMRQARAPRKGEELPRIETINGGAKEIA